MNDHPIISPAADASAAPTATPAVAQSAADLVARRQALRLTAHDIAQRLKLAPRQVEAIEAGNWAALPGPAFVRGVLRGYGRLVGVDVSALLGQLDGHADPLGTPASLRGPMPRRGARAPERDAGGRFGALWRVALAVVVLAALALYFGRAGGLSGVRSWIGSPADGADAAGSGTQPGASAEGVGPAGAAAGEAYPGAGSGFGAVANPSIASPSGAAGTPPPLVPGAPASGARSGARP